MKKYLFSLLITLSAFYAQAQVDVYLNINHQLGQNSFAFSSSASNNLGNAFNVSRLEYYIAEITLIHDGGQTTAIPNLWILANAGANLSEALGNHSITSLEGIQLGIGVESSHNHLDPSTYNMSHPLSPKSPSMHWGWAAGYRFIALEGKTGNNMLQTFEFHGLGDGNYKKFTIPTAGTLNGSDLNIDLNADYERAFENIDLSSGSNIVHGESGKAAVVISNFATYVFTSSEGNSSVGLGEDLALNIDLFPNPSNGNVNLSGDLVGKNLVITDSYGRIVQSLELSSSQETINFSTAGMYLIQIFEDQQLLQTEKILIVQ
tara:strand:+ start:941 stop:1897 length:957 start_codon:yes stop_codon:yes gene_type:complete